MADFNFFLNRQGIQGRKGDKGDTGFTPTISVSEQTLNSYKLKITNEYNEFETPNLIGNLGVTDNGGTYLRYDPTTGTVSTGEIDGATTEVVGGVRKSTDADLTNLSADTVVTPANVADMLPLILEAGTDNVTITQDEATSKTKISVKGGGAGDVTAAGNNRFTGDNTFTGKVNIAGGALTVDGLANLNQTTAQHLNAVSITSTGEINAVSVKAAGLRSDDIQTTENKKYLTELDVDNQTIQVVEGKLHCNLDELGNEVNDLTGRVTANEADISTMKTNKQNKLTAGTNVTLTDLTDGTVRIDATGGGGISDIPIATTTTAGKVKPDGTTITITDDGTISAVGGGGGGATIDDSTTATTSVWSSSKTNTEITTVADEVVQVQGDVASLDGDVSTLKTDVSGLKTDAQNAITGINDQIFDVSNISTKPVFTKRWKFGSAPDIYQQIRMYSSGIVYDDLCAKTLKVNPSVSSTGLISSGLQLSFTNNYGKVSTQGINTNKLVLTGGENREIVVGSGVPKMNIGNYPSSQNLYPILTSYNTKAGDGINITTEGDNVTISATGGGSAPTNMVTTDTVQDITANKTFYGEIRVGAENNYAILAKFSKEPLPFGDSTILEHIDLGEADFVVKGNLGKKVYETDKYVYKEYINVDDLADSTRQYNNSISSQIAHMAMPSNKYIDLTLGASGTTYTAPADGWAVAYDFVAQTNTLVAIFRTGDLHLGMRTARPTTRSYADCYIPCSKGDTFRVEYGDQTGNANTPKLRYFYAKGSEPTVW